MGVFISFGTDQKSSDFFKEHFINNFPALHTVIVYVILLCIRGEDVYYYNSPLPSYSSKGLKFIPPLRRNEVGSHTATGIVVPH